MEIIVKEDDFMKEGTKAPLLVGRFAAFEPSYYASTPIIINLIDECAGGLITTVS